MLWFLWENRPLYLPWENEYWHNNRTERRTRRIQYTDNLRERSKPNNRQSERRNHHGKRANTNGSHDIHEEYGDFDYSNGPVWSTGDAVFDNMGRGHNGGHKHHRRHYDAGVWIPPHMADLHHLGSGGHQFIQQETAARPKEVLGHREKQTSNNGVEI